MLKMSSEQSNQSPLKSKFLIDLREEICLFIKKTPITVYESKFISLIKEIKTKSAKLIMSLYYCCSNSEKITLEDNKLNFIKDTFSLDEENFFSFVTMIVFILTIWSMQAADDQYDKYLEKFTVDLVKDDKFTFFDIDYIKEALKERENDRKIAGMLDYIYFFNEEIRKKIIE